MRSRRRCWPGGCRRGARSRDSVSSATTQSLSQEQIELDHEVGRWRHPARQQPGHAAEAAGLQPAPAATPDIAVRVSGRWVVDRPFTLDGLIPENLASGQSIPDRRAAAWGPLEPLLWLHAYDSRFPHPFLLRRPLPLPAGAVIRRRPARRRRRPDPPLNSLHRFPDETFRKSSGARRTPRLRLPGSARTSRRWWRTVHDVS